MSVWVPSASHSGPQGQRHRAEPGDASCLPSQFSPGLGWGRMGDVGKYCQLAQNSHWSADPDCKSSMGKRRDEPHGKRVGGSGFETQQVRSWYVLVSYLSASVSHMKSEILKA